ncbi:thioredoxin family protein [Porticoccaceae bacterium LTM1]|nr:thioredoxin family protein [Porticoccaceae bacterium LTM1]
MKPICIFLTSLLVSCLAWSDTGYPVGVFESKSTIERSKLNPPVFGKSGTINLSFDDAKSHKSGILKIADQRWNLKFIGNEDSTALEELIAKQIDVEDNELKLPAKLLRETEKETVYSVTLPLEFGSTSQKRLCKVGLYLYFSKNDGFPAVARYSTDMYLTSEVNIEGVKHDLILMDMNYDGFFTKESDYWVLRRSDVESSVRPSECRSLSDFNWADGKSYKVVLVGNLPDSAVVSAFDSGLSEEQDRINRDSTYADKQAERSLEPMNFYHDFKKAISEAKQQGKMYFVDFETDWCGPCKQMDRYVYTAKEIVEAAKDIISIKVDGDESEELVKKYKVDGYPTGILFSPDGEEVARFIGYQSIIQLKKFFVQK